MLTKGIIISLTILMHDEVFYEAPLLQWEQQLGFVFLVGTCGVFICAIIAHTTIGYNGWKRRTKNAQRHRQPSCHGRWRTKHPN
jgi:hypothetical protein